MEKKGKTYLQKKRSDVCGFKEQRQTKEEPKVKKVIEIEGMHCSHCAKAVEKELLFVDGVKKARANAERKTAVVSVSEKVSDEALFSAVEKAGFKPLSVSVKKGLFDF